HSRRCCVSAPRIHRGPRGSGPGTGCRSAALAPVPWWAVASVTAPGARSPRRPPAAGRTRRTDRSSGRGPRRSAGARSRARAPARVHLDPVSDAHTALVLGHGAGGGVGARDLVAAGGAARALGVSTALVEQPYRVAGRRSPAPTRQLDAAWLAVLEAMRAGPL